MMMNLFDYKPIEIYCGEIPEFISELAQTKELQRLMTVGMNCGSEYTMIRPYAESKKYSRFEHSIGVALIVWNFTHDCKQAIAGLFHDISTPAFAHVVDYLNDDHEKQESTEKLTEKFISSSDEIQVLLKKYGVDISEVSDYHIYPIADNDSPMLSADRLEYTFGNFLHYRYGAIEDISRYYRDLRVIKNEYGEDEIAFGSAELAEDFALRSMKNSYVYIAETDRFTMQYLADLLKFANKNGIISIDDLYTTEENVIQKLTSNEQTAKLWRDYCSIANVRITPDRVEGEYCVKVNAKRRYLNPIVADVGRVIDISERYRAEINEFLSVSFDNWLSKA